MIDWTTAYRIVSVIDSMSKKTTFGEQEDIPKDGDGVAEDAATIIEETKAAPRRKSTRKGTATQPTTPAKQVPTLDAMAATGESEGRDMTNTGCIGKKTSPNWDSDTRLSRDMNLVWENRLFD